MILHGTISYGRANRLMGWSEYDWMCITGVPMSSHLTGRWFSDRSGRLRNWYSR